VDEANKNLEKNLFHSSDANVATLKGGKMKKIFFYFLVLYFLFLSTQKSFAYLGRSIRIMGLGSELAGVIEDEYTDIYRNPAYLSYVKKTKIFGQYNLYGSPELRIGGAFTNQKTGLGGVVLPFFSHGNLALVGELKPYSNKESSTVGRRSDYLDYYAIDSSFVERFNKETIPNFKIIYGLKLSPSIRLGIDFVYLKNYHYSDSKSKTVRTERYLDSDSLQSYHKTEQIEKKDDSPDAQRGSFGLILSPWQKSRLDFTLYYESIRYTSRASSNRDHEFKSVRNDTLFSQNYSNWGTETTPTENWGVGLDAYLKYYFPQNTSLAILLGGRYQKNDVSHLEQTKDTSYFNFSSTTNFSGREVFYQNNDKVFSFIMGIGAEKDFSPSIKIGVALKGYWDLGKLDRYERQKSASKSLEGDSVIIKSSELRENRVKKTINSYRIVFPIGLEAVLHKMIKARLGGQLSFWRTESLTGYTTDFDASYSQGLGFSYNDRILMDVYTEQEEINKIASWMVRIEYRF